MFDSTGKWLGQDFSLWRNVSRTLKGQYGARSTRTIANDDSSSVYHISAPIYGINNPSQLVGTLTIAKPVASVDHIIASARQQVLLRGAGLIGLSFLICLLIVWRVHVAVKKLVHFADDAAQGELTQVPKIRTTEFNRLALAMGKMRDELRGKRQLEQYTQALAHELKAPLSALAASNELLADPSMQTSDRERFAKLNAEQVERMKRSIDQMLAAARTEQLDTLENPEEVDWFALIRSTLEEHHGLADGRGVRIEYREQNHQASQCVVGNSNLLRLAVSNLLKNALDFSPAKSVVILTASMDATHAALVVEDEGPGVPDFAQNKVFDRFFSIARPDGSKGSGLGLTVVQHVARVHGGSVQLANRLDVHQNIIGCSANFSIRSQSARTSTRPS